MGGKPLKSLSSLRRSGGLVLDFYARLSIIERVSNI